MRIEWPGFRLVVRDRRTLVFQWTALGSLQVPADRCSSLTVQPRGQTGGVQLVFQFRTAEGQPSGFISARADVPAEFAGPAIEFVEALKHEYGIGDASDDEGAEADRFSRVPYDSREWIAAPAAAPAEELYEEVFQRIAAERAS
ncbi:hypothetical protein [Streptomyces sp. XD-27]|uniref:hypothetical protein n=1 Tax=Streptomyces sp. XD-27 TaxID=3062779 RepID=UPI0026F473FC|nr:hypothetical protein [Streptomyces sp. XD-27]WKX73094.1 hypothetical protein Q3Y56_27225 [Streptomyces sp. XD-27]